METNFALSLTTLTKVTTAVCKALRSLGLSKRKEHAIEDILIKQLSSSGPEYVLKRLSELTDWRKKHLEGELSYAPAWHKKSTLKDGTTKPSDRLGSQVWKLSDKAFFCVVGCLRKSIELNIPTEKQLSKWLEGVRCEITSIPSKTITLSPPVETIDWMEKDLKMKWQQREWFNPSHLTGSSIPGSGKAMSIRNRNGNISYASIVSAYSFSLSTAPLFIWKFLDDIKYPEMVYEVQGNLEQSIKLSQIIEERLQNERLLDEALSGNNFLDDDSFVDYQKFVTPILGLHHSVGNIGFLQQGSGKLRAVANPNRFVQYCNSPLGEVLSSHQQGLDGCFVYNQEAGIEWVKRKLKQGNTLASFDMSAATDRLDFQKFINEYFVNISDERHPLLSRSIELFKDTSLSPWSLPGFVADMLQMPSNEISWKIGQPLGLRPSFPLLTIMNCAMASQAVRNLDGYGTYNTFACVGDDLVIQAEYADAYVQVVSEFSGLINRDKGMTSSKYAEFCSQLITADSSYALKPRWIDSIEGSLNNIEKFQTSGLHPKVPEWIQRLYNAIAKRSIKGFTKYGYTKTDCYDSLKDRVAIHDFIQSTRKAPRDIEEITLQTLYMRAVSEQDELNQKVKCFDLSTSWAMPKLGQNKQEISTRHKDIVQKYDIELGDLPSDRATSVAVPGIQQWNYKEDCYSPKVSELNTAKKLLKTIESIKVESAGTLISASQETKHCRTEILTDLSNHESVIVHTNKATNTTAIQTKHNQKSKRLEDLLANLKIDDPTDEAQTSMETSY